MDHDHKMKAVGTDTVMETPMVKIAHTTRDATMSGR